VFGFWYYLKYPLPSVWYSVLIAKNKYFSDLIPVLKMKISFVFSKYSKFTFGTGAYPKNTSYSLLVPVRYKSPRNIRIIVFGVFNPRSKTLIFRPKKIKKFGDAFRNLVLPSKKN
jgi:hypothetical protein